MARPNWAKLDSDLKKKKADILKAYEKKMMAERKADQERRETYEKMMAGWEADRRRKEAESKAHQGDLQKMIKEMMECLLAKMDANQAEIKTDRKADRENLKE
jgi:hypothetical protein